MRNHRLSIALLLAVLLAGAGCSRKPAEPEDPFIGKPAPSIRLPRLGGGEASLEDFRGRIVLLDFWATWCGPCRMSMPQLERLQKENASDVTLLAINMSEPAELVRDYVERQRLSSIILLDLEGRVANDYGVGSIPMQVIVDQKGVVRRVQIGFSPRMGEILHAEIGKLRGRTD